MEGSPYRHSRFVVALLAVLAGGSVPAQATQTQVTTEASTEAVPVTPPSPEAAPVAPPHAEAAPVAPPSAEAAPPAPPPARCTQVIRNNGYELCAPAPLDDLGRGFQHCRRGRQVHPAVDIRGVGPDRGLGTPVRAIVRAEVTMVGRPDEQPGLFGTPDTRPGTVFRDGEELPRSKEVPGYGRVHFFTRSKGAWRAGATVVMRGLGGGLEDHEIRYMHLGAIHPAIRPGVIVEPGQEVGLMGATAVQRTAPHLHVDARNPSGRPLDLKSLLTGRDPVGYCGGTMLAKKGGKGKTGKVVARGKAKVGPKKAPAVAKALTKSPAKASGAVASAKGGKGGKAGVLVRTTGTRVDPVKAKAVKKGPRPERKRPPKPARSS